MRDSSHLLVAAILCAVATAWATAQPRPAVQEKVHTYRVLHEKEIVSEFVGLLSIPNERYLIGGYSRPRIVRNIA